MKYLNALWEELRISIECTWSYKINVISDILFMTVLYIAIINMNDGLHIGRYYGSPEDSKSLLLIGYILWTFSTMSISLMSSNIESEANRGTLEQKLMSIIPLYILMVGKIAYSFIREIVIIIPILIVSKLLFDVGISFNLASIIILLLTMVGMFGIGLIFGGLTIKHKKIGSIIYVTQTVLLFISDTLVIFSDQFPLINIIPLTKGNDLIRKSLIGNGITSNDYLLFTLITLSWIIVGIATFLHYTKVCKKDGLIGSY
ncbi:MAG: ABC transporter [Firmicutes bacterium]|nr:ABC transporter [Bacillota bacterium]